MRKITGQKGNFKFSLIEDFPGYNSATDKTKLAPNFLIRGSKNVYKKVSGTIASRPGLKRRGSASSTDAGVKSSFEWETNVGTFRALRVCNGKLQVESDIVSADTFVWYDLLETGTLASPAASLTRFVFDTWWDNDEKSDRVLMVRGDDKILHWSGGMAKVQAGASSSSGGINGVSITSGGAGYVEGDIVTVTGGGGTGGKIRILTVSGGTVTSVSVYAVGSGYSTGTGLATTGGSGSGYTAEISSIANFFSLTKQGTETWAELGFATNLSAEKKVIISGVEYSYNGGESTTTLTGIVTDTSGIVAGSVAIQSVLLEDNKPVDTFKADFIKVIQNQLWVGSYSSRIIYISADVNVGVTLGFANFTNSGALLSGDPDTVILDTPGRGIGVNGGKVLIFSGQNDLFVITPNFDLPVGQSSTPITGGSSRSVIQKVEKKQLAGLTSALGHEFIGNLGEYLIWLDQKNRLRALGTFTNNVDSVKPTTLSLPVQTELKEDDFTGGHLRVISDNDGDTVYITAPNNGRDWMYQVREIIDDNGQIKAERLWQPPQIRGISRFSVIEGVIYGHSNVNPQIYQVWETSQWFDDNPNDEQIPYTCVARFAYSQGGIREGMIHFDKVFFEGYMAEGVNLIANAYYDYQGAKGLLSATINSSQDLAKFFIASNNASLGDDALGNNPLGDGILEEADDQELVPKFRKIVNFSAVNCFEYSLEVYSIDADSRWELLCFGPNVRLASQNPIHLQKGL